MMAILKISCYFRCLAESFIPLIARILNIFYHLAGHQRYPIMVKNYYQYVMDKQKKSAVERLPDIAYAP